MKMMKRYLFVLAALAFAALALPSAANAACGAGAGTCFVVPAGGNSNSTSTWSASSGGATCTCVPAATDAVILDSAAGNLTLNAALSIASLDASGTGGSGSPYTGTLTHNASVTLTISGLLFKFSAGMTYTPISGVSSLITFTSTSGITAITTAGKTMTNLTFNGAGGTFQLQDDLTATFSVSVVVTHTAGTFDANGHNLRAYGFSTSNANTRTVTCGSGTWTLGGGNSIANVFDATTATNLTLSCASATIQTVAQSGFLQNFVFKQNAGTPTIGTINFAANANGTYGLTTTATYTNATGVAPFNLRITASTVATFTNAINFTGSASTPISFESATAGTQGTVNFGANSTVTWGTFKDLIFNAGAGTLTATNSFNLGNNTLGSGSISPPSSGGSRGVVGG